MKHRKRFWSILLLATCVTTGHVWAQLKPGIVVESVAKYSEAEKAGLQEGDLLLSWSRGDAKGEIESPFDLSGTEIEQAPRGTVTLKGFRDGQRRISHLGPKNWSVKPPPTLPHNLHVIY